MTPTQLDAAAATPGEQHAQNGFTLALLITGVRCILTYVVLPFVLPWLGLSRQLALPLDILLVSVAALTLIVSVRHFWAINYRWKVPYTLVGLVALVIYAAFLVLDVQMLLGPAAL